MSTDEKIGKGTAADADRKREMGAHAARLGKSENSCPYATGGWAWSHWMHGYRSVRPQ